MKIKFRLVLGLAVTLSATAFIGIGGEPPVRQACAAQPQISFSEDILPLLKWRCASCHQPGGEGYEKSGFDVTSYQGVMKGTKFGPMIVPGDPDFSNLMRLLDWKVKAPIQMPHGKKQLSSCDRDSIRTWIRQGANDN